MKLPLITGTLLLLLGILSYFVLAPSEPASVLPSEWSQQALPAGDDQSSNGVSSERSDDTHKQDESTEKRRNEMKQAYTALELSRKQLKSQANLIKSKIWGLELPKEQASLVSNGLQQAYFYLKNPPMLGAYFELEEINFEMKNVEVMQVNLDEIEALLEQRKE
jgi:hypothetical protein